jgi:lipoate-protein ligase A
MLIVQSKSTDVYRNLAVEEWLLDHALRLPVLFLCANSPCVVIGKNQNPWKECRLSLMEKEGVPLARRISGGGAVYHDQGNLNVGVIVPRTEYREEKQYELIFKTLEKFGITASKLRKNSLAVAGKKFSGQAFSFRGQHVLHHGTLLVNSDLKRLGRYLGSEIEGIETKAVASVPSQVMNLSEAAPELTVEKLSAALIETFRGMYGEGMVEHWNDGMTPEDELLPIVKKLSSNDWKLCHTPRFQVTISGQTLEIEKGLITNLDGNPLFEEWVKK